MTTAGDAGHARALAPGDALEEDAWKLETPATLFPCAGATDIDELSVVDGARARDDVAEAGTAIDTRSTVLALGAKHWARACATSAAIDDEAWKAGVFPHPSAHPSGLATATVLAVLIDGGLATAVAQPIATARDDDV
ncbi:MAG: hypothetical protein ABI634_18265 [Acidobacteriota bacterium]